MVQNLAYEHSVRIVKAALETIKAPGELSEGTRLGDILEMPHESGLFRQHVHAGVRSAGFRIGMRRIPIEPHFTIHDIALKLAASSLPGDPGIDDPSLTETTNEDEV